MLNTQTEKTMILTTYDAFNRITPLHVGRLTNFLFRHLGKYGDQKSTIRKAIQYAAKERPGLGGKIFVIEEKNEIIGAAVVNKTGMADYIPENILVYIATHEDYRGRGIGKKLMEITIENCRGSIASHIEPDNPAKSLYEKFGFTNLYLEMRLKR